MRAKYLRLSLFTLTIIIIGLAVFASQPNADEGENKMSQKKNYFVQLLGTRDGWPENMTPDEEKVMTEHFYYLKDLVKKKKVYMAGPVFDPVFGLVVLSTDSEEEAKNIMDNEPSVVAGVHTYEMHEMRASLLVDYQSPDRYPDELSDKFIRREAVVPATIDQAWEAWTTTEGVKTFFSSAANVELRIGGPYEIYFLLDAPYGSRGSEDCKILSYLPNKMLSFEWNAPPTFGELRGIHTYVVVQFEKAGENEVKVTLTHTGFGEGEDWDEVRKYFANAWSYVMANFKKRFEEGPLDWTAP